MRVTWLLTRPRRLCGALRDASQKSYSGECNQRGEDTDDCAYADSQDIDEYSEEDEGSEEETVEMERLERNEREEQLKALEAYPALLSLHGTGTSALAQADAYKIKPRSKRLDVEQYIFGGGGLLGCGSRSLWGA